MRRLRLLIVTALAVAGLGVVATALAGAQVSVTLTWQGWDDKTGGWWDGNPDGIRDAHFALTVSAPGETLTSIVLKPVNPNGTLGGNEWNTIPLDRRWILGVVRGGAQLNTTDVNVCDPIVATGHYDIYAEDDGSFSTGRTYRVWLTFASGAQVTADGVVGDVSGGPPPFPKGGVPTPSIAPPTGSEPCAVSNGLDVSGSSGGDPSGAGTLSLSLAKGAATIRRTIRAGACAVLYAAYDQALPQAARVSLERRRAGEQRWTVLKRGGASLSARACAAGRSQAGFRAVLRRGSQVLATSKLVTVVWR